jgi:hypothetical protein
MRTHFLKSALGFAGIAILLTLGATRAEASLIFLAPTIDALPGTTGTFDILLENTGPSSVAVGGFSFGISTTNPSILFTDATINTVSAPYIFGTDSLFGPDIALPPPGTSLTANDNPASVGSYDVAAGATVGLGNVSYSISSTSPFGEFAITFAGFPTSALVNSAGADIPITTLSNGSFEVTPEPSSILLALGGLLAGLSLRKTSARLR